MKNRKITKKILITAAVVVALATAIFAGTQITMISSSSNRGNDFTAFPTQQTLQTDFGFTPRLLESFSNGYAFQSGTPVESESSDGGHVIESFKSLSMTYANSQAQAQLDINQAKTILPDPSAEQIACGEVTLHHTAATRKFVPADYQLTAQDRLDQENGDVVFGYGTDEVTVCETQNLIWSQDGINYDLFVSDSPLTRDDLVSMAQELIALPTP